MDSRINYIANLKDCLTSHNSQVHQTISESSEQQPSRDDIQYLLIRRQIVESQCFVRSTKHLKIRLRKWLQYLDKIKSNRIWVKSRNKYIKLLNLMCYCECLIQPFNVLPPEGELPTLRKHEVNQIIDKVQNYVKTLTHTSRKMSQNSQNTSQAEQFNLFYSKRTQQSNRCHTQWNNRQESMAESEIMPLKNKSLNIIHQNLIQSEVNEKNMAIRKKKIYLKQSKENIRLQTTQKLKKSSSTQSKNTFSLGKNGSKSIKNEEQQTSVDTRKVGRDQQQKKIVVDKKKLSSSLLPPKCKTKQEADKNKFKDLIIQPIQKQYWESISNSEVHTPKYLNNYQSQQAIIDEDCIQVVSFRQSQTCDCSGQLFGEGWISDLFKKMTS